MEGWKRREHREKERDRGKEGGREEEKKEKEEGEDEKRIVEQEKVITFVGHLLHIRTILSSLKASVPILSNTVRRRHFYLHFPKEKTEA